jgi:hypothetical protein
MKKITLIINTLFCVLLFSGCNVYTYPTSSESVSYVNPRWAPDYYQGTRYYYLTDIETYYDLASSEFIFLNNGRWVYSSTLPSMYSDFDLDDCYVVIIDLQIQKPWMHHQYYVSHYPRYYYSDYYDHSNFPYVRGYNENSRSAVCWKESERSRARTWDNSNKNNSRGFKYTTEDRKQQSRLVEEDNSNQRRDNSVETGQNRRNSDADSKVPNTRNSQSTKPSSGSSDNQKNTGSETRSSGNTGDAHVTNKSQSESGSSRRTETVNDSNQKKEDTSGSTKATQSTNYYGKTIGQPVKVDKQRRTQTQTTTKSATKKSEATTKEKSSQRR